MRFVESSSGTDRLPEEEGQLHHAHVLDFDHVCRLLRCSLHGPHLHHRHHHRYSDCVFQGGHCYRERSEPRSLAALNQESELVLARDHHVLPLRRDGHLLLQAHCFG